MLDRKEEQRFKQNLQNSLDEVPVPDSLLQFAKDVPMKYEQSSKEWAPRAHRVRRRRALPKVAAVCAVLAITSLGAMHASPTFAEWIKDIPGFSIAAKWLDLIPGEDGVRNAKAHHYSPFEPVVKQFDDMTVSISDVYLSNDKLTYKVFIKSDNLKEHSFAREDGTFAADINAFSYIVSAPDLSDQSRGGGVVIPSDDEAKEPTQIIFNTIDLKPEDVKKFLDRKPEELAFHIGIFKTDPVDYSSNLIDTLEVKVPFRHTDWLEDEIIPLNRPVAVNGDPDIKELMLERIKITPTDMYLDVKIPDYSNYYLTFGRAEPYLTDDQGGIYPLNYASPHDIPRYRRGGDGNLLVFTSSPYFDESVTSLTLHLNGLLLTEREPGGKFTISPNDSFPKEVSFKGKTLTITDAYYEDVYLHLKIKKEQSGSNELGIQFSASGEAKWDDPELKKWRASGNPTDAGYARELDDDFFEALVFAPKQDVYEIEMIRSGDYIPLNLELPIDLSR
ncbi:DUF4179 domain-containing protein [Paenibacillus sp. J2TS4]|uniref:DUF4179 domain-containing protein n=1 Tax=Paenibacillus sp. J2TS4 TaxID=2807194 RepID=UPI001B21583F|nr:DUF4179 domain-containing protein [Paenibacillus sp. J2TS4]GIP31573.1 hypothetical protein J2TS4_07830 [Paenibacillus sp. J2TS4]